MVECWAALQHKSLYYKHVHRYVRVGCSRLFGPKNVCRASSDGEEHTEFLRGYVVYSLVLAYLCPRADEREPETESKDMTVRLLLIASLYSPEIRQRIVITL